MSQRLPDFLIIGAAKAGTTTLFRDLQSHPGVFFPLHKEPHALVKDQVLTDAGRAAYAKLFAGARHDQKIAEASTGYTKRPRYQGVPERARQLLGADLKVFYLVREPISRTISHHRHLYHDGRIAADINQVLRSDELDCRELIEIGKYAAQIQPWIDTLGRDQVSIVQFDSYMKHRRDTIESLQRVIGLEPRPDLVNIESAYNVTADRRYARGVVGSRIARITRSGTWKHKLRGLVPDGMVNAGKRLLFKPPLPEPPAMTSETMEMLMTIFKPDAERLAEIMGRPKPLWDFEKVKKKIATASVDPSHA